MITRKANGPIAPSDPSGSDGFAWQAGIVVFLIVLGAKWTLIALYGTDVPFGDQWDAEIVGLYLPSVGGEMNCARLFQAHSEHRIVATNMYNLILFWLCGDHMEPRVQVGVSSILHALWFGLIAMSLVPWLGRVARWGLLLLLLVMGAAPVGYENTLWGFQSQIYFVLLFWLGCLFGMCFNQFLSPRWWFGVGSGLLAVFSFGPGGLVGCAVAATIGLRGWNRQRWKRGDWLTLLVAFGLVVTSLGLQPAGARNTEFRPESVVELLEGLIKVFSWPSELLSPVGLLIWVPGLVLVLLLVFRRVTWSPLAGTAVALVVLGAANGGAVALYRGGMVVAEGVAPRYFDILLIGLVGNFIALVSLPGSQSLTRRLERLLMVGWLCVTIAGLTALVVRNVNDRLPFVRVMAVVQETTLLEYLETGDSSLVHGRSIWETSYPDSARLIEILSMPGVETVLPRILTERPEAVGVAQGSMDRPTEAGKGDRKPGSEMGDQVVASGPGRWMREVEGFGPIVFAIGLFFLISLVWRTHRSG
ncbi:MAG: hypothetical protein DRP71_17910 [Verrucomicrobia bacterium]|nr:MAG: hypothetical protein DRP71_17910 [Verrucomicrobiota bacterium]